MSHFAKIDDDNIVTQVIVAEQDFINSIEGKWIQTSYNTKRGIHICGGVEYETEPVEAKDAVLDSEGEVLHQAEEAVEAVYVEGKSPEDVGEIDGGVALRKNYAGIGYTYDEDLDAFHAPKPFASWILNEDNCLWYAPVAKPGDGKNYSWDEDSLAWVEVPR